MTARPYRGYRVWRVLWLPDEALPALASMTYLTYWPGPVSRVPVPDLDNPWWGLWACDSLETLAATLPRLMTGFEREHCLLAFGEVELLAPRYVRHEHGARGTVARVVRLWWSPPAVLHSCCSCDSGFEIHWWAPVHALDAKSFGHPLRLGRGEAEYGLKEVSALLEARYDCPVGGR